MVWTHMRVWELTKLLYQNIADEEISAGESASFIIAQMKAFNMEASEAEHIIDALNEVSNTQAVSSADLIARSYV